MQLGCTGVVCQDCYTRVFGEPILYFCPAHGLPVSTPKEDRQAFTDTASLQQPRQRFDPSYPWHPNQLTPNQLRRPRPGLSQPPRAMTTLLTSD